MSLDTGRKKQIRCLAVLLFIVSCLHFPTQLNAQVTGRTLSGKIISTTGTPIANAHVTLRNPANGDTKSIVVAEDGSFNLTGLSPGTFEITVSAPGFAEGRATVTIGADVDSRADIVMRAEAAGEAGASGVSGVVGTKSVTDLPLNGRSASDLAALEPGVSSARTQSTGQAARFRQPNDNIWRTSAAKRRPPGQYQYQ